MEALVFVSCCAQQPFIIHGCRSAQAPMLCTVQGNILSDLQICLISSMRITVGWFDAVHAKRKKCMLDGKRLDISRFMVLYVEGPKLPPHKLQVHIFLHRDA